MIRIADISDEYSNGNLHLTTRQDVQIHYISLEKTPELWAKLEQDDITLREACGNTVRNITASSIAGIDPKEPFDITPYANALFKFFLRNPIQENLGRKFKIAFSSSEDDTAFTFIHDLGFIPKVKIENGTLPNEQIAVGTISTIEEIARNKNIDSPAVIVAGEVVKLHPEFVEQEVIEKYLLN